MPIKTHDCGSQRAEAKIPREIPEGLATLRDRIENLHMLATDLRESLSDVEE
jgi:hypothetical protein